MAQDFNPSIREAETGGSLSLWPAWSTELVSRTGSKATQGNPVSKNKKQSHKIPETATKRDLIVKSRYQEMRTTEKVITVQRQ